MSDTATSSLVCPKCAGVMRSFERSGVTIDQCGECRGIFLDRGELERLLDAEDVHYQQSGWRPPPGYDDDRGGGHGREGKHGREGQHGREGDWGRGRGRRGGGFFGELFGGDD